MSRPIVIFGIGDFAAVAHFYLTEDRGDKIVAFTVDAQYLDTEKFCDLPVIPFEEIETIYPSDRFDMFIAIGYRKVNAFRTQKFQEAKAKGYQLISYVSSKATTWSDLSIGENCFILEDNTIQPFVKIGDNVTLWSGNHVGHHSQIGNNCFITSHVVISGGVEVGDNCFLGVNSTIRDRVKLGKSCVIAANALILKDTKDKEVYTAKEAELSRVPSNRLRNL